ncbi:hypothetical protein, partial [Rhizobium brockwellii]|uniref:hypothetical protein n=1 Tax=Rhizobium brockwellii TaxID=3019932 RepID=UPI003F96CBE0
SFSSSFSNISRRNSTPTFPPSRWRFNARILEAFEHEGADAWFAEGAKDRFLGNDHDHSKWTQVMDILDVRFDSGST